ncbi:PRC and DUF2382 domain-containing protein [Streptomyces sodiiphilus]|uniref:PRC and DUF2382 domain-containing protein n=1 Tax=Streptomyces sodiiphilus TaxID=226217 RepID=A0ABN2P4C5_9ACTN
MITKDQISTVLDHPVYDTEGSKIGRAEQIFLDDTTDQPEWATVHMGMFGGKEAFLPLHDATVVEDHLEVPYDKDMVKDAPEVHVDDQGHMEEQEEERLYRYYGISPGGRRSADLPAADDPTALGGAAAPGLATAPPEGPAGRRDDAMTRSEEEMHVGVERRESGRARLRKHVVTEHVQQSVPVRHEEVRVEREPITEENRGEALSGPAFAEDEYEVTLHEERPVTHKETKPVERVRLTVEERTDEELVEGEVRKERIEAEGTEEKGRGHA